MTDEKILRINALAKKAKAEGLTKEEEAERDALRSQLDNTYIQNADGTTEKLKKKSDGKS